MELREISHQPERSASETLFAEIPDGKLRCRYRAAHQRWARRALLAWLKKKKVFGGGSGSVGEKKKRVVVALSFATNFFLVRGVDVVMGSRENERDDARWAKVAGRGTSPAGRHLPKCSFAPNFVSF